MKFLKYVAIVVSIIALAGCGGIRTQVQGDARPWTHLNLANKKKNFQFAIVADRTGGHRPGVFAEAVTKLNLLKPEFVMTVGDMIEGTVEDDVELDRQWDEFDGMVKQLDMPFFYVPGNHDISNEVMIEKWRSRLGPSYYHFVYRNVLFLCANTEDPPKRSISDEQIEYFRNVLIKNRNVRWTLVFMHQPVWQGKVLENWREFESLLEGRDYTVFAGHVHTYSKSTRNDMRYYTLAVTGGAGKVPEVERCKFDHIVWVTMTDKGPLMANLLLEGIFDDDPCGR